jgi:hypothetical protein
VRRLRFWDRSERGQGLVEFAMLVPVFMVLLLGLLEFGFVFDHAMTINYATREGARSGAAFAQGNNTTMPCADVDKNIIAAVQRVLYAPGSLVRVSDISNITIYRAMTNGTPEAGKSNVWTYAAGAGPSVDGSNLDFIPGAVQWNPCTAQGNANARRNDVNPDSLGVSITYTYRYVTPLAAALGFFGPAGSNVLTIRDRTVMALNPLN